MPKYKVFVKLPWPGSTQRVGRNITIEAPNSMTATLQARGQYGAENVIGGGVEIPEPKSSNNSPKPTYTNSSGKSSGEHFIKEKRESIFSKPKPTYTTSSGKSMKQLKEEQDSLIEEQDALIKDVISLGEKKFGKNEFKKLVGKDPKKLTFKEAMALVSPKRGK